MNKEIQDIRDLENEFHINWCDKVKAFMTNNFPIGSKITKDKSECVVTGYDIRFDRIPLLVCEEVIRSKKYFDIYELYDMVEKEGGQQ